MKKIKQERGITLIALVITIIILLILAGVAISSLAGENGVITKAKEAKIQTTRGQIQEILDLAVIEGIMLEKSENELFDFAIEELKEKGYTVINKTDNSTTGVNKIELSESKVQVKENESKTITVTIDETSYTNRYYVKIEKKYFEILQDNEKIKLAENETDIDNITPGEEKQIEVTGASYCTVAINQATKEITITGGENLGTDTLTVKYGGKQVTCEVKIVKEDNTLISKIKTENYGDVITGYEANGVSNWKIFLKDDNGVWIISSDYVELDSETATKTGLTVDGCIAKWDSVPDNGQEYDNENYAVSLSNTENWTKYVNTKYASKAMGGPTIEMFTKSYNAKNPSKTIEYELETTTRGYKVKWNTGATFNNFLDGIQEDELYCVRSDDVFWVLAIPGAKTNYMPYFVVSCEQADNLYGGPILVSTDEENAELGLRPVVCLNSNLQVTSTTSEGVTSWKIEQ